MKIGTKGFQLFRSCVGNYMRLLVRLQRPFERVIGCRSIEGMCIMIKRVVGVVALLIASGAIGADKVAPPIAPPVGFCLPVASVSLVGFQWRSNVCTHPDPDCRPRYCSLKREWVRENEIF